jgi:hypothetical protein
MKGRPFLGVFSGFFFGLFGAATLFLFGAIPLDSHWVWILPIVGIVLGLLMATLAPFGSSEAKETATTGGVSYASAGDAAGTTIEQDVIDPPVDDAGDTPHSSG